ncbi:hypothetical protein D3C87_657860 [compost metagenome]
MGILAVHLLVGPLEQADRLVVVVAPVDVWHPLTGVAGIIQIEHGGHRIHPQTVDVELVEPEQGARHQELAHVVATEIVDVGVPVRVPATARILVLVERSAVEAGETMGVGREVGRHPVEDDAYAGLVAGVDEMLEVIGTAVATGGGEHAHRLIAPGAAEGVLGDRHQLDVGVAHLGDVVDQLHRQLAPVQAVPVGMTLPGAHVQLVDGERLLPLVVALALAPGGILPLVLLVVVDDGGERRILLAVEADRIALVGQPMAGRIFQFELVTVPGLEARHEQHPVTALAALHGVATAIPEVEIADQAHRCGARRIDGEAHPCHLLTEMLHGTQLRAQGVVEVFRLEAQFSQAFPGGSLELVRVDGFGTGIGVAGDQLIGEGILAASENSFKKARFVGGGQGGNYLA